MGFLPTGRKKQAKLNVSYTVVSIALRQYFLMSLQLIL